MSCAERLDQLRYPVRNGGDDPRSDATKVAISQCNPSWCSRRPIQLGGRNTSL